MKKGLILVVALIALVAVIVVAFFYWSGAERREERGLPIPALREALSKARLSIRVEVEGVKKPGEKAPVDYTCDAASPAAPRISWKPAGRANTYAIIVVDPDAPRGAFYHLVVYNIPGSQNTWPPGGTLGVNSAGEQSWFPICPPPGHGRHRYYFIVLGVAATGKLQPGLTVEQLLQEIRDGIVAYGYTYAVYER